MMRALLWKEFHEQAGRWLLATILLAGTTALLVHARLISIRETLIVVLMLGGMLMSSVLMIAPLPSERSGGTLGFLLAIPAPRRGVLFTKWLASVLSITALYAACCIAALVAAWTAGLGGSWVFEIAAPLCVSMLAYHSFFFFFVPFARHELDAALQAFALAIIALVWSAMALPSWVGLHTSVGLLGPVAPAFAMLVQQFHGSPAFSIAENQRAVSVGTSLLLTSAIWIIAPGVWLLLTGRLRKDACAH
jgi:ABC-type transport system involved in multi-copper enzyme maturation permease subunit